jgi:hypothetical protein
MSACSRLVTVVVFVPMVATLVGTNGLQLTVQVGLDDSFRLFLFGNDTDYALGGEATQHALSHTATDQYSDIVKRVLRMGGTFVKGLFFWKLKEFLAFYLLIFDVIDPEFPATSGMAGDLAAVLAGNGDFHRMLLLFHY